MHYFLRDSKGSLKIKRNEYRAAQSVKRPTLNQSLNQSLNQTLDFSSGHDLTVRGFKPRIDLRTDSVEPA